MRYGICKINTCVGNGIRQHSVCSCCCKQKQIIIEYKTLQQLCYKNYDKIVIAINNDDYKALIKLLDDKLGIVSRTANI